MSPLDTAAIQVFSTCPQSRKPDPNYLQNVIDVARWSEEFGYVGILVYSDNGLLDPWLISQIILQNTRFLAPLVAIQPIYMHPYTAAKMVATYAHLYGRRIFLNMLAGGFKNDLTALNDNTPHDDRYTRMVEYTLIIRKLLETPGPVSFEGKYYSVKNLKMTPPMVAKLFPGILSSGSSDAGLEAAKAIGAIAVRYPKPPGEADDVRDTGALGVGVRVGIIARDTAEEAWTIAHERFPEDRKGQLTHQLAMKVSDSQWHKQLSQEREDVDSQRSPYWLGPFQNYGTFCPYLVGTYAGVAGLVAQYIELGYKTFILDIPPSREELSHTGIVFRRACNRVQS